MSKCNCFTCAHKTLTEHEAYYRGYIEACEWFLNWAKEQNIRMGSIGDNDLSGIYAQIDCNYSETKCLLHEVEEELKKRKGE